MADRTSILEEVDRRIDSSKNIHSEEFIATEGQTSFILENIYNMDTDGIFVEVGGVEQHSPENFTKITDEANVTTIVFSESLPEGMDVVVNYYGGSSNGGGGGASSEELEKHMNNVYEKHVKVIDSVTGTQSYKGALILKASDREGYTPSTPINARN